MGIWFLKMKFLFSWRNSRTTSSSRKKGHGEIYDKISVIRIDCCKTDKTQPKKVCRPRAFFYTFLQNLKFFYIFFELKRVILCALPCFQLCRRMTFFPVSIDSSRLIFFLSLKPSSFYTPFNALAFPPPIILYKKINNTYYTRPADRPTGSTPYRWPTSRRRSLCTMFFRP